MSDVEVIVGTVGRPHGLAGEVTVLARTDEPERRFARGALLRSDEGGLELTVAGHRWHGSILLVSFAGVADRFAAEQLRGVVLTAQVSKSAQPEGVDEYYDRQLVGLAVCTADGVRHGDVVAVQHLPSQDLLVVRTPSGQRLVPFVSDLVPTVDLAAGTCTVVAIPGLLDDAAEEAR